MRMLPFAGIAIVVALLPALVFAQQRKKASEEDFVKEKPAVGDPFPDLVVYDPSGTEVKTSSFRGQYTVLTFGCLT
jgi:cytochrome oxidase Cu insertion factor (SCO1/SenC/PrrC family)